MTESEKFVADLCNLSFLPFWSFPSPIGKKGNELCDLLVVCNNIIIIISVKDITPSAHEDEGIVFDRWQKKAITESVSQIYGAEKYLSKVDTIQLKDSDHYITLPPKEERVIFRVAIAFGSKDHYPLPMGHFEEGYVSVFDEQATTTILKELDTITDFTNYLAAKQKFLEQNFVMLPHELDFLAFFIQTRLALDIRPNTYIVGEDLWKEYAVSEERKRWQMEIEVSYVWDIMIQSLYQNHLKPETSLQKRNRLEKAVRLINLEPRMHRMELGMILENAMKNKVKARMLTPLGEAKHTYVFMPLSAKNWEAKSEELELRCLIARATFPAVQIVIGIAAGNDLNGQPLFDIQYHKIPEIDQAFIEKTKMIQQRFGFFVNTKQSHSKDMRPKY